MSTEIAITHLTSERFAALPQTGLTITQEWPSLMHWLATPVYAASKQSAGAWCPAVLAGGIVKAGTGAMSLLVFDVDDCTEGAIDHSADTLAKHAGVVVPTFSATPDKPKHRIVLVPSRPLTDEEFSIAWPYMAGVLARCGIVVDKGCKNLNRLYFACVARSPDAWLGARVLTGEPVDVGAMLAVARELAEEERRRREHQARNRRPVRAEHRSRYIAGAMEKAGDNVAGAPEGGRHEALLRESYSLARFDLSEGEIAGALLGPFVCAAGEARRSEGEKAIADAVRARKAVA